MNITLVSSPQEFSRLIEPLLMQKEACNNLMLGIIQRLLDDPEGEEYGYLGYVEQDHKVVFAFMQTPKNWILADASNVDERVVQTITQFLFNRHIHIPSIIGPEKVATMFVKQWEQLRGLKATIHMEQLIYQLDNVNTVPIAEGELIPASETDHDLIAQWLVQFGIEANEHISEEHANKAAAKFIDNQSMYVWQVKGEPVSMVNRSRRTKHSATINAVFTPDIHKQKGYATSAVATLSEKLLESGFQFCSLYTDLKNPVSNSIYKKIGYYVVGDSIVYKFS
ncbi:GNAT family N-acetyltransferase [Virgibacillus dakarensis]|nr:GNAT family N-acetyltransferase [Virgibacillus dakarensis]